MEIGDLYSTAKNSTQNKYDPNKLLTNNFWLCLEVRHLGLDLYDLNLIQPDYFQEHSVHQFET